MPKLKYHEKIDELDCLFDDYKENEREAFRWTFEDINDSRNFLPRTLCNDNVDKNVCGNWGLSFFDTKESSIERIAKIAKNKKNIYKLLGTHIAQGVLDKTDGISNNANKNKHFELFEYDGINLKYKFNIIGVLQ